MVNCTLMVQQVALIYQAALGWSDCLLAVWGQLTAIVTCQSAITIIADKSAVVGLNSAVILGDVGHGHGVVVEEPTASAAL